MGEAYIIHACGSYCMYIHVQYCNYLVMLTIGQVTVSPLTYQCQWPNYACAVVVVTLVWEGGGGDVAQEGKVPEQNIHLRVLQPVMLVMNYLALPVM